jgi:hypothetical protein
LVDAALTELDAKHFHSRKTTILLGNLIRVGLAIETAASSSFAQPDRTWHCTARKHQHIEASGKIALIQLSSQ